jgi:spermidine synthase
VSVLHRHVADGRVVEVRAAGRTRRLYVDGVFHTEWNSGRPLTGAIWDHLALPTFLVAPEGARRVLMLGVGGGAVLRILECLAPPERVVGVELDGLLLRLGRDWFGLAETRAELVEGDAGAWVRGALRRRRERFDLVVDDVFGEEQGNPVRPRGFDDGRWWRRLSRLLAPGGVLVVNFVGEADLTTSDLCQDIAFRRRFPAAFRFSCRGYENAAVALMSNAVGPRTFRARLHAHPALRPAAARRLMRFRVHRLWPR